VKSSFSLLAAIITSCVALTKANIALAQAGVEVTVINAETGASAAGIVLSIENAETGSKNTAITNENGRAHFGALSTAGRWKVISKAQQHFQAGQSVSLQLRTNYTETVRLVLASGIKTEETLVTASRSYSGINRINAEVSSTLTATEISTLPIEARSLDRALLRLPNVTQSTGFFNEAPSVAINGANSLFSNYMIDGLDNNENFLGGQRFPTPIGIVSVTPSAGEDS